MVAKQSEVIVVGAGPAGIVAAIAASRMGLHATVLDARVPPIDKPCGEGILPQGVAALAALGIAFPPESSFPFRGIRFVDGEHSARADFAGATGWAMRRVKLHSLLVEHAARAGVQFRWGQRVTKLEDRSITVGRERLAYNWLIGADGQNSQVRKWAGLDARAGRTKRFGICSHFRLRPWCSATEVHWAPGFQVFVTPVAVDEIGVAVLSRDPHLRLSGALPQLPELAERLRGAEQIGKEFGDATGLRIFPGITRSRVALIGDAAGTVDAVTGHGLSLSFQLAMPLAEAMTRGDLVSYARAHRKAAALPVTMSRLMALMDRSDLIRHRTIRAFEKSPGLFAKLLAIHTDTLPVSSLGAADLAGFGWRFLRT